MTRWIPLVAVAALMLPACGGDDDSPQQQDPFLQTLAGTWRSCDNDDPQFFTDYAEDMTISGTTVTSVIRVHTTTDLSCAGTVTGTTTESPVTFVLGGNAPATFRISGTAVTARAVDVNFGGTIMYTILYVDTAANPDVLYTGDDPAPGDPAHDGTTPEKRHVLLNDGRPRVKQ